MTGEQMGILNNDFFNQEVECLRRRVGQVECNKTHEEIAKTSLVSLFILLCEFFVCKSHMTTIVP